MIAFGTMSIIVLRVMPKYELISSSASCQPLTVIILTVYLLITSTSCASFSDNVPEAFSCGGGASMAAIFFLFFDTKKLPKKPEPESGGISGLADRGGIADAGRGLPVFGSTCVGFDALCRSLTIAIACIHLPSEEAL